MLITSAAYSIVYAAVWSLRCSFLFISRLHPLKGTGIINPQLGLRTRAQRTVTSVRDWRVVSTANWQHFISVPLEMKLRVLLVEEFLIRLVDTFFVCFVLCAPGSSLKPCRKINWNWFPCCLAHLASVCIAFFVCLESWFFFDKEFVLLFFSSSFRRPWCSRKWAYNIVFRDFLRSHTGSATFDHFLYISW